MCARAGVARLLAAAAAALVAFGLVGAASARLPSPPTADDSPAYSTDGTQIAYAVHHDGGPRGWLVVGSANGGHLRSVYTSTDACCHPIAWASSTRIVFVDDYQLKSVDLTSGKVSKLATGVANFILSPNRQTVALAEGCECNKAPDAVALVDVDGRGYRLVPKPKNKTDELDGFSPDGTHLVFTRYPFSFDNPKTNEPSLYALSIRRNALVPLSKSGLIGASQLPATADNINWSPDGRWLSFFTSKGIWLLNTSHGKQRLAVSYHGSAPPWSRAIAWSPASGVLAYGGLYPSGQRTKTQPVLITRLTLVNTVGVRVQLWNSSLEYLGDNSDERPQWAPNGKSLIFIARPAGSRAWAKVYVVGANGRGLHRIG